MIYTIVVNITFVQLTNSKLVWLFCLKNQSKPAWYRVSGDPTGLELSDTILHQFCYWAKVSILKCIQKVEFTIASMFYTRSSKGTKVKNLQYLKFLLNNLNFFMK